MLETIYTNTAMIYNLIFIIILKMTHSTSISHYHNNLVVQCPCNNKRRKRFIMLIECLVLCVLICEQPEVTLTIENTLNAAQQRAK